MSEIQATLHGGEAAIGPEVLGADRVARTTLSADDRPLVRYVLEIGLDRTADVAFAFPFLDRDQLRVTAVLTLGGATHTATLGAQVNAVDSLWPPPGAAVEYEVRTTTPDGEQEIQEVFETQPEGDALLRAGTCHAGAGDSVGERLPLLERVDTPALGLRAFVSYPEPLLRPAWCVLAALSGPERRNDSCPPRARPPVGSLATIDLRGSDGPPNLWESRMENGRLIALVTGADHGLGASLCSGLATRGHTVFAGRYAEGPDVLDGLVDRHRGRIHPIALDVTQDGSVAQAARDVAAYSDRLDLAFNNAGVLGDTRLTVPGPMDFRDVISTFDVNAVGPLRVINAFFPLLMSGPTKIVVNVSSEAGSIGATAREGWYGYCMSKAALNMVSALTHNRLRPHGGKVIVVHPGWMRTRMRGVLDVGADITPETAADGILRIVERAVSGEAGFSGSSPAFLDYRGDPMPW